MEPVVTSCVGCGKAIRIRRPDLDLRRACPACGAAISVPTAEAPAPRPAGLARQRARAIVSAAGLLELTLVLMVAAPTAVHSAAAWNSAGADSPPVIRSEPRAAKVVGIAGPLAPIVRADALRGLASNGLGLVAELLARAASSPALLRVLAAARMQDGLNEPARGDAIASPPPTAPTTPPLLTPPHFGAPSDDDLATSFPVPDPRRFLLRDEDGRQVVARLHGSRDGKSVLMLPDGRLGIPSMLVPTDEPFEVMTADEVARGLLEGPFAGFKLHRTEHYLILYQSPGEGPPDDAFARSSGDLLEELYRRLIAAFRKHDVTAHEAEFPLVAVIFKTEKDFREYRPVAPDVQAYYEIYSNRIYFYEQPSGRRGGPEVDALLKPQTAAHEGTHQVLQNIGVQPRLGDWPLWLVEGLAEYCATPASRKGQPAWDGLGQINNLHMATIRELEDPLSVSMKGQDARGKSPFRNPGQPLVEAMIRRTELTPTEYALAWAITHYLAMKRSDDFTRFLRIMAAAPPLESKTADDHVKAFRQAFGDDLGKLDKTINNYLSKLTRQKGYDPMPYYAVTFEQPLPDGRLRRAAMVSQSPQLIKEWVDDMANPAAGGPSWQAIPFPSRARATLAVQEWIQSN